MEQNKPMLKRLQTPKGFGKAIQNLFTQSSECTSEETIEFTGGFQFHPLAHAKSTPSQQSGLPSAQKLKRHLNGKGSELFSSSKDLGRAGNASQKDGKDTKMQTYSSIVDIRTTIISNEDDEQTNLNLSFNKSNQKSMNNLGAKEPEPTLQKSGTQPTIPQGQQFGGFEIRTSLVNNDRDFKKEKRAEKGERGEEKNKTVGYLNIDSNPVREDIKNKMAASRVINDSRITLRDYMFMANTSSRKAADLKRHEIEQQLKAACEDPKKALKTEPALPNTPKPNIRPRAIRQRYQKQKYHISNTQMADVLKQSIKEEISQLSAKTASIERWMDNHQSVSNQQLILLYNMRNDLINYNKKFEESIGKLSSTDNMLFLNAIKHISEETMNIAKLGSVESLAFKGDEESQILELAEI